MDTAARIPDELAEFLASGVSIVVATRDAALQPDGVAACAARVHDGGARLTVYCYVDAAAEMLLNLADHPAIALDFDLPTSHRACQVKGDCVGSRPAREDERGEVERQLGAFAADLEKLGVPRAAFAGWKWWPCTALDVRVREIFEQTPGPGAGEPLR